MADYLVSLVYLGGSLGMKVMDSLGMDTSMKLPHAPVRIGMLSDVAHGCHSWLVHLISLVHHAS